MVLKARHIGRFDQRVDIINPQETVVAGEVSYNRTTVESDVNVMEVKASGSEDVEQSQVVNTEKRAWVYRKFSRSFTTKMIAVQDSKDYYIVSIRPFGSDRSLKVMECEARDNQ